MTNQRASSATDDAPPTRPSSFTPTSSVSSPYTHQSANSPVAMSQVAGARPVGAGVR